MTKSRGLLADFNERRKSPLTVVLVDAEEALSRAPVINCGRGC